MLDIRDFGFVDPTGQKDCTPALMAALNAIYNASGPGTKTLDNTIYIPQGIFLFNTQQIVIPHNAASLPNQALVRLVGAGSQRTGLTNPPTVGTVLDLQYGLLRTFDDGVIIATPPPTITASSGTGNLPATQIAVVYTYYDSAGTEYGPSLSQYVSMPTGTNTVSVAVPAVPSGMTGIRVYFVFAGNSAPYPVGGAAALRVGQSTTSPVVVSNWASASITANASQVAGNSVPLGTYHFQYAFYNSATGVASFPSNDVAVAVTGTNNTINFSSFPTKPSGFDSIAFYVWTSAPALSSYGFIGFTTGTQFQIANFNTPPNPQPITSATVKSTTSPNPKANFSQADVGRFLVGPGLPSGSVITAVLDAGHALTYPLPFSSTTSSAFVTVNDAKIASIGLGSLTIEHMSLVDRSRQVVAPVLGVGGGTINAGALATIVLPTAQFQASDIGKWITITGAGPSASKLVTRIQNVTSPPSVQATLADAASQAVTLATVAWADAAPFILVTNTQLRMSDVHIYGTGDGDTSNMQDAVIFGGAHPLNDGVTHPSNDGTLASAFSGYGTVLSDMFFSCVRRALFFRAGATNITFRDSVIWSNCGASTGPTRTFTDGSVVAGQKSLTSTGGLANFTQVDVGSLIVGANVPFGTYIASVTDGSHAQMSAAATTTGSPLSVQLQAPYEAAIDMAGFPNALQYANIIEAILIEAFSYATPVRLDYMGGSILIGVNSTDQFPPPQAAALVTSYMTQNSGGNMLIFGASSGLPVVDLAPLNTNIIFNNPYPANQPGPNTIISAAVPATTVLRTPIATEQYPVNGPATALAANGTIGTTGVGVARVAPTSAVSGIILQAGTVGGQEVAVLNESTSTITFATATTSNVADADGTTNPIPAKTSRKFAWDSITGYWYRMT